MGLFSTLADFILHIDGHLQLLASEYGLWLYGILFLIVFCETGLVVFPLLPGDSLLFAAGSLAAIPMSQLSPHWLFVIFTSAALLGDTLNYWIGRALGPKVFHFEKSAFFNPEHLQKTHAYFEKYGGKTIIIARFIPIVRTFTPFVAGIGSLPYPKFISFSIAGALLWVGFFSYGGYFFGQLPVIKSNLKLMIVGIIAVSLMIPAIEFLKRRLRK
ncbi:MAG: DedA family protein [Chlorobaculum sp.]|jgi:membrane-associated protein|nr:DedA family protein [Chlorobaculum sp.]